MTRPFLQSRARPAAFILWRACFPLQAGEDLCLGIGKCLFTQAFLAGISGHVSWGWEPLPLPRRAG